MNEKKPIEPEVLDIKAMPLTAVDAMVRAEVDVAVSTAHRYPRNIATFHEEMDEMVTQDQELRERCYYSLVKGDKLIQGASIRFAEAVQYAWRNLNVMVRYVGETPDGKLVVVQGAGMDLERGVRVGQEVTRRISDREGKRYSDDVVATTIRAASAIARREVVLSLVPAFRYRRHLREAQAILIGADLPQQGRVEKLAARAKEAGATREQLLHKVGKRALSELTEKDFLHLWGFLTALDDGMMSLGEAFPANGGSPSNNAAATAEIILDAAAAASANKEG